MEKFLFLVISFIALGNLRAQGDVAPVVPDGQEVYILWDFIVNTTIDISLYSF